MSCSQPWSVNIFVQWTSVNKVISHLIQATNTNVYWDFCLLIIFYVFVCTSLTGYAVSLNAEWIYGKKKNLERNNKSFTRKLLEVQNIK